MNLGCASSGEVLLLKIVNSYRNGSWKRVKSELIAGIKSQEVHCSIKDNMALCWIWPDA